MSTSVQHVGIDAGGTCTSLRAEASDGRPPLMLRDQGANLLRHGAAHTARLLASMLQQVLDARPDLPLGTVVAGVAGAGRRSDQHDLARRIRRRLGRAAPQALEVVHDGVVALEAAFLGLSGMLIIAGTGSAVLARTRRGRLARVGGWGYLVGDEGSGYALGRRAMRAIAHAADGGPTTTLGGYLQKHHGIAGRADLLAAIYKNRWPLQHLAPIVLRASEEGDAVAREIVTLEVNALAQQARWLHDSTAEIRPRLCLPGGLSRSAHYRAALSSALQSMLPAIALLRQTQPATLGAAFLARRLADGTLTAAALHFSDSGADQ